MSSGLCYWGKDMTLYKAPDRITSSVAGKPGQVIQPGDHHRFFKGRMYRPARAVTIPDDGTGKKRVRVDAEFVEVSE